MKRKIVLTNLLVVLFLLIPCCSQKTSEPPELNPQSNQIELFCPEFSGESICLDLQELNALEGPYSGLEMIYANDNYEFIVRLPAIEKFQVWVGLCTAEGCIIEYQADSLPVVLETSDFDSVYDIFNEQQIHPELMVKSNSGSSYSLDNFIITINSFSCADNIVEASGTFSGFLNEQENKPIQGSFKIIDFEIDHRFVE